MNLRTTVTFDPDVAAALKRVQREGNRSFKELVNAAIREGLPKVERPQPPRKPYRVKPLNVKRCFLPNLDCLAEVLAIIEGEDFK